jgi:hypothetical protein
MPPNIKNSHLESWEKKIEKKALSRSRKGKPRMKVSGAGVKNLQRIMIGK